MSNHFHLVLQPEGGQSISRIIQSLTVAHTWRVHKQQGSVGHVWQGRFKSPVIQDDNHLFVVMRYVESNPLRAGIVTDMADHGWSSYAFHALGLENDLVNEAPGWSTLANSEEDCQTYWRQWVHTPLTERELVGLRQAVGSGRPYGSESWVERMASRLGIDLLSRPRGCPSKLQKMN
jgi:putative transposase